MKKRITGLLLIAVFFVGMFFMLPPLTAQDKNQDESPGFLERQRLAILKKIIAKNLPRDIQVGEMDTFLLGLRGARITDFKMTENRDFLKDHPDIDPVFLKADSILVRINPLMILLGQVYIKEMTINNPRYQLIRDKQGNWNFDDLSEAQDSKLINWLRVKNLSINNAAGRIVDHSALNAPATANVNNVDIRIDDFTIGEIFDLNIKAATPGSNKQNFIMKGRAGPLQLKQKNEQIPVDADLNIIDLPIVSYNRYAFPENSPVFPISGNIDVDLHLKGDAWSGMTLTGSLDLENMVFQAADQSLKGEKMDVGLYFREPVNLSLKKDRLAVPALDMVVNGNIIHINGHINQLGGLSKADLSIEAGDIDIDAIQAIYPFILKSFPPELHLGGHLDMKAGLEGTQMKSQVNGQLDLTAFSFCFGDYFRKPPQEHLEMTFEGLINTKGIIEAKGAFAVGDCLLGRYNFLHDVLTRLLKDAPHQSWKQQLLADYQDLPHTFDSVKGKISYSDNRVSLDRIRIEDLGPAGAAGIDGQLDGTLNFDNYQIEITGEITVAEKLSRRVIRVNPGAGQYLKADNLILGFQHTGRLEDLNLEIFPAGIRMKRNNCEAETFSSGEKKR